MANGMQQREGQRMTDTIARLRNWGAWSQTDTGAPQGYPATSPMFAGANRRDWHEQGWGDEDSAPEEIPVPIDVPDAEYVDKLVQNLEDRLRFAITIEYASPAVYRPRRPKNLADAVAEATMVIENLLAGGNKKVLILDLHAKGKTAPKIAEIVGVSHQYVYQITICK